MLQVTFSAAHRGDLLAKISDFLQVDITDAPKAPVGLSLAPTPLEEAIAKSKTDEATVPDAPMPEAKRRGRKPKQPDNSTAAATDAVPPEAPASVAPSSDPTAESVRALFQKLIDVKGDAGMDAGAEILAQFGYQKVRDIKESHFAEISTRVQAAIDE